MTVDHPRRIRPSAEKRQATSLTTHAALSAQGAVSAARPVPDNSGRAELYAPPATGANVVTGQQDDETSTSITSTLAGSGTSEAGPYAVAIGDAVASGNSALALGVGGTATGPTSVGIINNSSSGTRSFAFGVGSDATADDAIAFGAGSQATGVRALAIGGASVSDQYGIAIGMRAAAGVAAVAIGPDSSAPYTDGVALGDTASATGVASVALGVLTTASGQNSVAIGAGASTSTLNEIVLGVDSHIVIIKGKLCLADSSGDLHQIVVSTGGALSTVPYP